MREPNFFPVDIYSVKKYGVKKWQGDFFWPVADREFAALCSDLDRMFCEYIETSPCELSDILLLQRNSVLEYWHFLHAVKVIDLVRRRGLQPFYCDQSMWYKAILERDLHKKPAGFTVKRVEYRQGGWRLVKTNAAMHARSIYYNFTPEKIWQCIRQGSGATIFGRPDTLQRQYMQSLPYWISLRSPYDLMPVKKEEREILSGSGKNLHDDHVIARDIVQRITSIAQNHQIILFEDQANYLYRFTVHQFTRARAMLTSVERILKRRGGVHHLLVTVATAPVQRTAAIAVRKQGGKVTMFTHGGHIGIFPSPTVAKNEFALANEFVTYTKGSVALFKRMLAMERPLRKNTVVLTPGNGDMYLRLWREFQKQSLPIRIHTAMVIGFPYNPWRRPYGAASLALMNLDFELRLVRFLKEHGYRVIYKAHPDRLQEAAGIFDGLAEVIRQPFETVLAYADAFIFGCIRTTTFPLALATNRPVIACMMHDENPPLFPDVRLLLEKRCTFIRLDFDERNRIMFNDGELLGALSASPRPPNTEFLEQYLLP